MKDLLLKLHRTAQDFKCFKCNLFFCLFPANSDFRNSDLNFTRAKQFRIIMHQKVATSEIGTQTAVIPPCSILFSTFVPGFVGLKILPSFLLVSCLVLFLTSVLHSLLITASPPSTWLLGLGNWLGNIGLSAICF